VILVLYNRLREVAKTEFADIVLEASVMKSSTGRARKLRLALIDETYVDVWYSEDRSYAYHWEQASHRNFVYRHDNAPHQSWRHVPTFPKHCHEGTESNVKDSHLPDDPEEALRDFLKQVRRFMIAFDAKNSLPKKTSR
jgi:hypothetical protein